MHSDDQLIQLLKNRNLRNTSVRRAVLGAFLRYEHALSHSDIQQSVSDNIDRVSIYRTLKKFTEAGLIHEVMDEERALKYSLCQHDCSEDHYHDDHLHFTCEQCHHTFCLTETQVPKLQIPSNYKAKSVKILVTGLCPNCEGQ